MPTRLGGAPRSRSVRLVCGLILFAYVTLHLIDHSLGNISIDAMNAMLSIQKWIWQSWLGTILLYGAVITHASLGLWSLYTRRYSGWTRTEAVQLVLGLCIPALLANHFTVTRLTLFWFGNDKRYEQELHALWIASPAWGLVQLAVLVVAWSHGCIGVWRAIRLRGESPQWRSLALTVAVVVPVLAMLGFVQGVREELRNEAVSGWHPILHRSDLPAQARALGIARDLFLVWYGGTLLLIVGARLARRWHETQRRGLTVRYPDGRAVRIPSGMSILDASRMAGIHHASVCGGRGRCSTCRVRVRCPPANIPLPSASEQRVLAWVGLDAAYVRLACQLRPRGDVSVMPLVPPEHAADFVVGQARRLGEEAFIVAMFVDLRDSTHLTEARLPYDAMFLVARFVGAVAHAIDEAGGQPNQFTGDGVFALFGLDAPPAEACRQALRAVDRVSATVARLARSTGEKLRCGVGVHCGRAIIGDVGYGRQVTLTALGDVVNVAARLEQMTRSFDCEAIVSEDVIELAGYAGGPGLTETVSVRGRSGVLRVRILEPLAR